MSLERPRHISEIKVTQTQIDAIQSNLRTSRALALLQFPVAPSDIEKNDMNFNSWEGKDEVTMKTFGGTFFLKAEPSEYVYSISSPEDIKESHVDCANILSRSIERNDTMEKREERMKHTSAAGMTELLLDDAVNLITRYADEDRPFAVLQIFEKYNISPIDLPRRSQVTFMWAYAEEQKHKRIWAEEHKELRR